MCLLAMPLRQSLARRLRRTATAANYRISGALPLVCGRQSGRMRETTRVLAVRASMQASTRIGIALCVLVAGATLAGLFRKAPEEAPSPIAQGEGSVAL